MSLVVEPEILNARRAFADSQELLGGEPLTTVATRVSLGWHDTSVSPEVGAFALVDSSGEFDDWIGEILLVTLSKRSCYVYVLGSADVPTQLSLSRRAFLALAVLSVESIAAVAQVIG